MINVDTVDTGWEPFNFHFIIDESNEIIRIIWSHVSREKYAGPGCFIQSGENAKDKLI